VSNKLVCYCNKSGAVATGTLQSAYHFIDKDTTHSYSEWKNLQ